MSPNDKSEARCAPEKAPACACGHLRVDHRPVRDEQHCLHCRCNDFAPATEGAACGIGNDPRYRDSTEYAPTGAAVLGTVGPPVISPALCPYCGSIFKVVHRGYSGVVDFWANRVNEKGQIIGIACRDCVTYFDSARRKP